MTDPIADMLIRIRNAQAVKKDTVQIPFSHIKYQIAKVLEQRKFIKGIELKGRKTRKMLELTLKYDKEKESVIVGLKRVSKKNTTSMLKNQTIQKSTSMFLCINNLNVPPIQWEEFIPTSI